MKKIEVDEFELEKMQRSCDTASRTITTVSEVLLRAVSRPLPKAIKVTICIVAEALQDIDTRLRLQARFLRVLEFRLIGAGECDEDDD